MLLQLEMCPHWLVAHAFKKRGFGKNVTRLPRKIQQHFGWTKKRSKPAEN